MSLSAWIVFSITSLFILAIPGPITLLAMARASTGGVVSAVPLALGAALGDGVALLLSFAGIGAILQSSDLAFAAVRVLGASYLLWVGGRMLFGQRKAASAVSSEGNGGCFREGFLLAVMHPASLVFFVAYVPLFIVPDDPVVPQFALMTGTFVVLGMVSVFAWAVFASMAKRALLQQGLKNRARLLAGGAMMILGGAALADAVAASLWAESSKANREPVAATIDFRTTSS